LQLQQLLLAPFARRLALRARTHVTYHAYVRASQASHNITATHAPHIADLIALVCQCDALGTQILQLALHAL
jgi:hypothetical protein